MVVRLDFFSSVLFPFVVSVSVVSPVVPPPRRLEAFVLYMLFTKAHPRPPDLLYSGGYRLPVLRVLGGPMARGWPHGPWLAE